MIYGLIFYEFPRQNVGKAHGQILISTMIGQDRLSHTL